MYMDDERPMSEPTDEPMDDSLRELVARVYDAPEGTVPRDAMWANISAARRAARATPAPQVEHGDGEPRPDTPVIPLHRRQRTIWRWSAALAAGLVLGVAVDRALVERGASGTAAPQVASNDTGAQRATDVRGAEPTGTIAQTPTVPGGTNASSGRAGAPSTPRAATTEVATTQRAGESSAPATTERAVPDPADLYRAAAVQTLVQAEALLTAYRSSDAAPDPVAMQQAARWARDVLSSTRLLMDSPAARDPRMGVLFSDLELVLAQIVQLSGAPLQAPERELIERALRDRDLLPRLRSAVPAGLTTS